MWLPNPYELPGLTTELSGGVGGSRDEVAGEGACRHGSAACCCWTAGDCIH